jgi:hypothetical protein
MGVIAALTVTALFLSDGAAGVVIGFEDETDDTANPAYNLRFQTVHIKKVKDAHFGDLLQTQGQNGINFFRSWENVFTQSRREDDPLAGYPAGQKIFGLVHLGGSSYDFPGWLVLPLERFGHGSIVVFDEIEDLRV